MAASYATISDFKGTFGNEAVDLSNMDDPAAETVNSSSLQRTLDDATAEMDMYLIKAVDAAVLADWKTNPANAPAIIKRMCMDIGRYLADRISTREEVTKRYEKAILTLKGIANRSIDLGVSPAPAEGSRGGVDYYTTDPTGTNDFMRGF